MFNNVFIRKFLSCIIASLIMISIITPLSFSNNIVGNSEIDIPNDWSKSAIIAAISNSLLVGSDGKINPNDKLKRCEMATILNRAYGATEKGDISKFVDVNPDKWYASEMAKAFKMETFIGSKDKMRPEEYVSRQEAFSVLARALKLESTDLTQLDRFSDKYRIASWAKSDIAALVSANYVIGNDGRINPLSKITRAEFAQVMYNIIKTYINKKGVYTRISPGNVMINTPEVSLKDVEITGDLIIGDGVGTGNVTLDNVKVSGRTVVRGGGANSIHIINGSSITDKLIVDNTNNQVRIVTDNKTKIDNVEAGSQVVLEGKFGVVSVIGNDSSVEVKGDIETLAVESNATVLLTSGIVSDVTIGVKALDALLTVDGASVENLNIESKAEVVVSKTAVVGSMTIANTAQDTKIEVAGTVTNVNLNAKTDFAVTGNINKIEIAAAASSTTVILAETAKVETLTSYAKTDITGSGLVSTLEAKSNDVNVTARVAEVRVDEGITGVIVDGQTVVATSPTPAPNNNVVPSYVSIGPTLSANADLSTLSVSSGTLYPTFISSTTQYYVSLPSATDSITISPTVSESHATVTVNQANSSNPVSLSEGSNTIEVLVTSQNGQTKSYWIYVTRADGIAISDNTTLGNTSSNICNNSYNITAAGTYGPETGTSIVTGNVYIGAGSVTMKNISVLGNLTFGAEIAYGDVTINNVTVSGRTIANGGGANSIHIKGSSSVGIVEVNDLRAEKNEPIHISAEDTAELTAVAVTNPSEVKVSNGSNGIGYVAAIDGSSITYGETNKTQLLDKIYNKANEILDAAISGSSDADKQYNLAAVTSLTQGVFDVSGEWGIWALKYYINPLDGVAEYQSQYNLLEDKLLQKGSDNDFIKLRDDPSRFATLYDQLLSFSPELGYNQMFVSINLWDILDRYMNYRKYTVDGSENIVATGENTENGATRTAFITLAQSYYNNIESIQSQSAINDVAIIDNGTPGFDAGDQIEITFLRRIKPADASMGQDAIQTLITSDTRFGETPVVSWSLVTLSHYGNDFQVSKCTITIGANPDPALVGGIFTIPKEKLGSYIPDGFVEHAGEFGAYITNRQPVFDINIIIQN